MGLKKPVYGYNSGGELVYQFDSAAEAERSLNYYQGAITEYISKHDGKYKGITWTLSKKESAPIFINRKPEPQQSFVYMSETELRKKHDLYTILMNEVKQIPDGKFIEESQLLRKAGLWGKPGYRSTSDRPEFKPYKGKADKTIYFGSQKSIEKLKMEGVLS